MNLTKFKKLEKKHYTKKLKKSGKFLEKLNEEDLNRLEKHQYNENDDLDYKEIKQIENLFDEINEDYYKPIKTKGAFNNNYIEYESRGDKDKNISVREYLFMIMPYLRGIIEYNLSGKWKIQLTLKINFISSLDPREIRIMDLKSDNVEITMGNEKMILLKNFLNLF